jgi:glycosyltransferase involved in cell wall biosynthesis
MTPFFSIVIPLYNKEKYIKDTLTSVLNQTFTDFEVIIVNDGSTDTSIEEIEKFNDPRILVFNQPNMGLSEARNTGIKNASADYLAFIDADDFWYEHHLDQLYQLINLYPGKGLYSTGYTLQKSETIFHRAKFNDLPEQFIGVVPGFFKHSLQNCIAWVAAICIPKKVFKEIGYFDPEIFSEQDTDLYIRIALKYQVVIDDTSVSAIYNRTMDDNLSNFAQKTTIPKLLYSYKKEEHIYPDLKRYMDYNRFSTIIYFKLSSNKELANTLKSDIDFKNLTALQRLLIRLPIRPLRFLFYTKNKLYLNALHIFKPTK